MDSLPLSHQGIPSPQYGALINCYPFYTMQSGKQAPQLGGRRTSLGHLLSKAYIKGLDGLTLPLECSTCWSQLYSQSERVSFKHSILSTKIVFSRPSYCQTTIQWLPKWYQPWKDPCLFVGTMDTSLQLQSHMQCHQQKCNYSLISLGQSRMCSGGRTFPSNICTPWRIPMTLDEAISQVPPPDLLTFHLERDIQGSWKEKPD